MALIRLQLCMQHLVDVMVLELEQIAIGLHSNSKKNQFKTLTDYLHEKNYFTICDIVNKLVIPKQNFDEFLIHDEQNDNLYEKHCTILEKLSENKNKNFFTFFQFSNIHTGIMNEVLRVYDNFSEEYF